MVVLNETTFTNQISFFSFFRSKMLQTTKLLACEIPIKDAFQTCSQKISCKVEHQRSFREVKDTFLPFKCLVIRKKMVLKLLLRYQRF
jgi:hypothetical protein